MFRVRVFSKYCPVHIKEWSKYELESMIPVGMGWVQNVPRWTSYRMENTQISPKYTDPFVALSVAVTSVVWHFAPAPHLEKHYPLSLHPPAQGYDPSSNLFVSCFQRILNQASDFLCAPIVCIILDGSSFSSGKIKRLVVTPSVQNMKEWRKISINPQHRGITLILVRGSDGWGFFHWDCCSTKRTTSPLTGIPDIWLFHGITPTFSPVHVIDEKNKNPSLLNDLGFLFSEQCVNDTILSYKDFDRSMLDDIACDPHARRKRADSKTHWFETGSVYAPLKWIETNVPKRVHRNPVLMLFDVSKEMIRTHRNIESIKSTEFNVKRKSGISDKEDYIIYIPMNLGECHWVAWVVYVKHSGNKVIRNAVLYDPQKPSGKYNQVRGTMKYNLEYGKGTKYKLEENPLEKFVNKFAMQKKDSCNCGPFVVYLGMYLCMYGLCKKEDINPIYPFPEDEYLNILNKFRKGTYPALFMYANDPDRKEIKRELWNRIFTGDFLSPDQHNTLITWFGGSYIHMKKK